MCKVVFSLFMDKFIAEQIGIKPWQVAAVLQLMEEGVTIPFIARYRKKKSAI